MPNHSRLALGAAVLTLLAAAVVAAPATPARGQDEGAAAASSGHERFRGTWRYAGSAAHGEAIIERAVVAAVDGMNFITQPIATGRLRGKNPLVRSLEFTTTDTHIRVVFDGNRTYRTPIGGWANHTVDGAQVRVQFRIRGDSIVQLFRSDGGTRRNVYTLLPNGQLRLAVTVQSGSLPRDMTYRLNYRQ